MVRKAPGEQAQGGVSLLELHDRFPDEQAARQWFEEQLWPAGQRACPRCGSTQTRPVPHENPMPYHCADCRQYFSVRTGTALARSKVPLHKWAVTVYLCATSPKGVSSLQLHRLIGVTQKTAWFMLHRIREAWDTPPAALEGPVEVDEAYFGGREKNKHACRKLRAGRGAVGKTPVVGLVDRNTGHVAAQVVEHTDRATLHGFIQDHVWQGADVYTDEARAYRQLPGYWHATVRHGNGEYVRGVIHTNGIESFWSLLKRAYMGTYHYLSSKHLHRYVNEFAGRKAIRGLDTLSQMGAIVEGLAGRRLTYQELIQGVGT